MSVPTLLETIKALHFDVRRYSDENERRSPLLQTDEEGQWVAIPGTFSGYSCSGDGGEVAQANRETIKEKFARLFESGDLSEESCPIAATEILGRVDLRDEELNETIAALAGYPVLDDDQLSKIENEGQAEAWEDYMRQNIARVLLSADSTSETGEKVLGMDWSEACGILGNASVEVVSDGTDGSGRVSWYVDAKKAAQAFVSHFKKGSA